MAFQNNFLSKGTKFMIVLGRGAWLLVAISLLLCVMGIYSTVALDTRGRRKEVTIRKINGAKSWDIAKMFCRLYLIVIALAIVVTTPLGGLFYDVLISLRPHILNSETLSPVLPIILSCLTVITIIAIIVGWQVRGIMRVNPAEIIAK